MTCVYFGCFVGLVGLCSGVCAILRRSAFAAYPPEQCDRTCTTSCWTRTGRPPCPNSPRSSTPSRPHRYSGLHIHMYTYTYRFHFRYCMSCPHARAFVILLGRAFPRCASNRPPPPPPKPPHHLTQQTKTQTTGDAPHRGVTLPDAALHLRGRRGAPQPLSRGRVVDPRGGWEGKG